MSLISDALKTAQRERSGQAPPGSGDQPLLEGFFPYVSASAPDDRSKRLRIALISGAGLVVLVAAAWIGVPAVRRAMGEQSGRVPPIAQPGNPAAVATTIPPVQIAPAADTQAAVAIAPDPVPAAPRASSTVSRSTAVKPAKTTKAPAGETMAIVPVSDTAAPRRDAPIAQPAAPMPAAPERHAVQRRNFETEAIAAFNAGDYATARARFDTAVQVTPTASAWTNYGVTLEKLDDPQGAARAYRSAMGIDPNYFNAWLYLARVYNLLGDVTQAVPLFNRALEIEPTNSDVNADLAELEFKAGAFTDARRYADVATRSNRSNSRAQYYLALAADTLKDRDVARRAFEDYLLTMVGLEKDNAQSIGYARSRLQALKGNP